MHAIITRRKNAFGQNIYVVGLEHIVEEKVLRREHYILKAFLTRKTANRHKVRIDQEIAKGMHSLEYLKKNHDDSPFTRSLEDRNV